MGAYFVAVGISQYLGGLVANFATVPRDIVDPLQAHIDLWTKWTDADMHNMTAYLASLK